MDITPEKLAVMTSVTQEHMNSIPGSTGNDDKEFFEKIHLWLGAWWKHRSNWASRTSGYSAFLLNYEFSKHEAFNKFAEKLLFREAPDSQLGGRLYVADYALTRVFASNRTNFVTADDVVRELKTLKLDRFPCVVFDVDIGLVLFYREGISKSNTEAYLLDDSFSGTLTVMKVDNLLTSFHNSTVRYPTSFPQLWAFPAKHIPCSDAEKFFQSLLYYHIKCSTQGTLTVVREDQTNAGLTDLTLVQLDDRDSHVIEMKVLKSFNFHREGKQRAYSHEKNVSWATEGLQQVVGYRRARNSSQAFLLLYDMRAEREPLPTIMADCANESVNLRPYEIENLTARQVRARNSNKGKPGISKKKKTSRRGRPKTH